MAARALAASAVLFGSAALAADDWLVDSVTTPCTFAQNADGSWTLSNGLVSRTFITSPGFGTVDFYSHVRGVSLLRAIDAEGYLQLDGKSYALGGILQTGTYYHAYLNRSSTGVQANPSGWGMAPGTNFTIGAPQAPFPWTPGTRGSPTTASWPPKGLQVSVQLSAPSSAPPAHKAVTAWLVYEIYEGIPLISKWLVVNSTGPAAAGVVITGAIPESLRLSQEYGPLSVAPYPPSTLQADVTSMLYVQTDAAHGTAVQWADDSAEPADPGAAEPQMITNYTNGGPGVILSGGRSGEHNGFRPPLVHPSLSLAAPVAELVSFRTFELVTDTNDPERFGLAVRRLTRMWAPHVQENPIFFHYAGGIDNASWAAAVDQAAAVGFEMMIFSFGTAFNLESTDPTYIAQIGSLVSYAHSKGLEVGGYDLICLQRGNGGYGGNVGLQWDTVLSDGKTLGEDACFASGWNDKLGGYVDTFLGPSVGLNMLETDGPYGGEACASTNHSHHIGASDSVYQQTRMQAAFYADMRARNIYVNQPDNFFFQGGSKTGMGYNEDQFSLPRWQDVTVSRMTVYDETYRKIPSQGWMFVPLIDYHGGGADAAFEPMSQHLPEYNMALAQYLGAGVAACYRGTRLYDTPEVQAVVAGWVAVYKKYRDIITSDIIHVRRADGQGIDGWLHANSLLPDAKGWAIFFNPSTAPLSQTINLPLYYTGIQQTALVSMQDGPDVSYTLARDYSVALNVTIPAQGVAWYVIRSGDKGGQVEFAF